MSASWLPSRRASAVGDKGPIGFGSSDRASSPSPQRMQHVARARGLSSILSSSSSTFGIRYERPEAAGAPRVHSLDRRERLIDLVGDRGRHLADHGTRTRCARLSRAAALRSRLAGLRRRALAALAFQQQACDQRALEQQNGECTKDLPPVLAPQGPLGEEDFTAFGQATLIQGPLRNARASAAQKSATSDRTGIVFAGRQLDQPLGGIRPRLV